MRVDLNSGILILLILALCAAAAGQAFLLLRLRSMRREIKALQKEAKDTPLLRRLIRNTQRQIDTLFYELLHRWDALSRDEIHSILKKVSQMRPTRVVPPHLEDRYTMGGRVPIEDKYRDSAYSADDPLVYAKEQIDAFRKQIQTKEGPFPRYGMTNVWLFESLEKYPIRGKSVAIMGSNKPWYESVCLQYDGACTTIEYNKILTDYPGLKIITPEEYDKNPVRFDAALSISSFEHDGLGRFGDPLNPEGDLEAMKKMKKMLKPGGILFLAVPVGKDAVLWNANRVYGKLRLPLLLEGWKTRETFGFEEAQLERVKNGPEPLFVLENLG